MDIDGGIELKYERMGDIERFSSVGERERE